MPNWALIVTRDPLRVPKLEEAARLAGLSPRRAPDLARARVLAGRGDPPAAVIVDPGSCGEEAFTILDEMGPGAVGIVLDREGGALDAVRAERLGAHVLPVETLAGRLPGLIPRG